MIYKFKPLFAALLLLFVMAGCEDFLDTESYTKKNTSNFPTTEEEAQAMITGIYMTMNDLIRDPEAHPFMIFDIASDDRLGGGSTSNVGAQSMDRLLNNKISWLEALWKARYAGIYRANNAIETLDNIQSWSSDKVKSRLLAETHFLRAYFYFDLIQVFGQVPLKLSTVPENLPKNTADEVYEQIAYDLEEAIKLFPNDAFPNYGKGKASKWAAEALMARVYLFYTGFYKKSSLPIAGGGEVTKQRVIGYVEDCINNSGHSLVSDQRNIWPYTNPYTGKDYQYVKDNGLLWEGDNCKETLFAMKFSNSGVNGYFNRIVEYYNPRLSGASCFPFVPQGYSNGPVSTTLWNDWQSDPDYVGDYRRVGSICYEPDEIPNYAGDKTKEVEKTRLWAKKYLGVGAYDGNNLIQTVSYFYGGLNNRQQGLNNDLILIRMADVYLMHSELTETNTYLNKVRERAKLPAVAYSLNAIKKERRFELCFEGLRWNDLRRWGDVQEIVKNQEGVDITNRGVVGKYTFGSTDFMTRYQQTGGGFWKIPDSQVILSEGVLEQNPGWEETYNFNTLPYYAN
jgi:hypothetical protein